MLVSRLNAECCSCCAANRKAKGAGNPGKPGKKLRLEDLQSQFGVGLKEAANRLGICPTTLKVCTACSHLLQLCSLAAGALHVLHCADHSGPMSLFIAGSHEAMHVLCREHAGGMAFSAGHAVSCSS